MKPSRWPLAATWSQPNRQTIAAMCRARRIALLASHDDATEAHVAESSQLGSVIAEFPTTLAAAQASRQHGMHVPDGRPPISCAAVPHSGNIAAHQLASSGLLDILSSDYYPASLLDAAFRIADAEDNAFTLAQAIRLVSKHPAQALGLDDRGVIAEGETRRPGAGAPSRRACAHRPCLAPGNEGLLMPGKLIWLVGPSGSGKDSLLAALREREHPQLLVAHRYITRPFNAGSENHIALSEHEFLPAPSSIFLLSAGTPTILTMALAWRSTCGCTLALTWWPTAPAPTWRWPGNATARCWCRSVSPSRRRCSASGWSLRGRENALEIAQRLDRAARYKPDNCLTLNNDGSLRQSVDDFFRLLRSHVARVEDQPV